MLVEACRQQLHVFAVEQNEAARHILHASRHQGILHRQRCALLQAVVGHAAEVRQCFAELQHETRLAVAAVAPHKPHAIFLGATEGLFPCPFKGIGFFLHAHDIADT